LPPQTQYSYGAEPSQTTLVVGVEGGAKDSSLQPKIWLLRFVSVLSTNEMSSMRRFSHPPLPVQGFSIFMNTAAPPVSEGRSHVRYDIGQVGVGGPVKEQSTELSSARCTHKPPASAPPPMRKRTLVASAGTSKGSLVACPHWSSQAILKM